MVRYERVVSGSMRWVPSMRISRTTSPPEAGVWARDPRGSNRQAAASHNPMLHRAMNPTKASPLAVFEVSSRPSGYQAGNELDHLEVHKVVPCREDHQQEYQSEPDPETVILYAGGERPTPDGFERIEQQMAAVKHGDGQDVDETQIERENRKKPDIRNDTALGHIARHLGDPDRTLQLVSAARAGDHLPDRLERSHGKAAGLLGRPPERQKRIIADVFDSIRAQAEA